MNMKPHTLVCLYNMDIMNEYLESGLAENPFDDDVGDTQAHALLINTDLETPPLNVDIQEKSSSPKLNEYADQRTSTVCKQNNKVHSYSRDCYSY